MTNIPIALNAYKAECIIVHSDDRTNCDQVK